MTHLFFSYVFYYSYLCVLLKQRTTMQYLIKAPNQLKGAVALPASKSISNRALIINSLTENALPIENLADCDDTNVMIKALSFDSDCIDIGAAGTAMRFLTAFLTDRKGVWQITGSQRMRNRPIKVLVEALRALGAEVEYLEKEGFPPLKIYGKKLKGGVIDIDGGISSQYLSALLMMAPVMEQGLQLNIRGTLISKPYMRMTLEVMRCYGVQAQWMENTVDIRPQNYRPTAFRVESDWSGASYWYQMLSLVSSGELLLKGLFSESLQGDSRVAEWFEVLGVHTEYVEEGARLTKIQQKAQTFEADFTDQPDLAQTLAMTCFLKNIPFRLTGVQSLKIKETDRIAALIAEGRKFGAVFTEKDGCILEWSGELCSFDPNPFVDTYEDHRMAMAFAPVALVHGSVQINHPEVVSKSYPTFWDDLKSFGFTVEAQ